MKKDYKLKGYVTLFPFMPEELDLKGVPYIVFAIIFGFSSSDRGCFDGSLDYLMKWTNSSNRAVLNALEYLCENNLIIKEEKIKNGCIKFCSYRANLNIEIIGKAFKFTSEESSSARVNFFPNTSEESSSARVNFFPNTSEESSHNILNNILDNKLNNNKELSNIKSSNKEHEEIENSNDDYIPTEEEILKGLGIDKIKF